MTSFEHIDPKILAQSANKIAERQAQCKKDGGVFKKEMHRLAVEKPAALAELLDNDGWYKAQFDEKGHISGYISSDPLPWGSAYVDKDLNNLINKISENRIRQCNAR